MKKQLLTLTSLALLLLAGCNSNKKSSTTEDNGKYDYVFLAQPAVTAVMQNRQGMSVYANVQNDYKAKSGDLEITQASVFVKSSADQDKVNQFLAMLKSDVSTLLANPSQELTAATSGMEEERVSGKLGGKPAMLSNLLKNGNQLGIGYKEALTNKAAIDAFIGTIGLPASREEIYFTTSEATASTSLELNVAVPSGAPAIAFYKHLNDSKLDVDAAETVVAYLSNNSSKDVVIAPTNAGIAAINKGVDFKLAATITFGNFFIIATGNDDDGVMNKGDKVLAFQENGVPGKIFSYVYGDKELDIKFVKDAQEAKNTILTEK